MPRGVDGIIYGLATRQHGMVARRQLLGAGVRPHAVEYRLRTRALVAVHAGVYQVGPVEAPLGREMAATLACGQDALLSHVDAGRLWQLLRPPPASAPIEVTVPGGVRCRPGLRVHRLRSLAPEDATRHEGIPVTTPARTLFDLASRLGGRDLERAVSEALALRLTDRPAIEAVCARHPRTRGGKMLRAVLEPGDPSLTRSEAEERLLALVREAGLPRPRSNVRVQGLEVDFLWPRARLVVEVDGFAFHGGTAAFERDRQRDGILVAGGYSVIRVTWRKLSETPMVIVRIISQALARADGR